MRVKIPRIAVLLAAYEGQEWIAAQLNSILQQRAVQVDVFISVDRSKDRTFDICKSYALREKRVILLDGGERFGNAARNFFHLIRTVEFDHYEYVAFSDQDDIWLNDKLECACSAIEREKVDGYSSNVMAFWPNGKVRTLVKSQRQQRWDYLFEAAGPGCTYVMTQRLIGAFKAMIVAKDKAVVEVGSHDWLVYAFARANGLKWFIDRRVGLRYRQHRENEMGANVGARAFVYRANKVLSGWGLGQSALIAELVGVGGTTFVQRWTGRRRIGMLYLALHAGWCRRRTRDQYIFAAACCVLAVVGRGIG